MHAFRAGDETAFNLLFGTHAAALRGFLMRMTGSSALAADLTQVTFLSVVRGRGRFLEGSRFKPWLYAIAMNALTDYYRRSKRELLTPEGTLPETPYEKGMSDPGMARRVHAALAELPTNQREAVVLHRFGELSFEEIAAMTGVSQSAVKVRAHRGYERLRELLKEVWGEHA